MKKIREYKAQWRGKIKARYISNTLFDGLSIRKAILKNVVFENVDFKNSSLGSKSKFYNCAFINCKFYGRLCSLGQPCTYVGCNFQNCNFTGTDLFRGQRYYDCVLSGRIKSAILNDKHPKVRHSETMFIDCDLSQLIFDNVNIYGKNIFKNSILPHTGIRLFDNTNDSLLDKAKTILDTVETKAKIESKVIFLQCVKRGQNPIILDEIFLNSFFKTDESKRVFDTIINGHELEKNQIQDT